MGRVPVLGALTFGLCGHCLAEPYDFGPVTAHIKSIVGPEPSDLLTGAWLIFIQNGQPIYQRSFGNYAGVAPSDLALDFRIP
jgi:hypothetical protein